MSFKGKVISYLFLTFVAFVTLTYNACSQPYSLSTKKLENVTSVTAVGATEETEDPENNSLLVPILNVSLFPTNPLENQEAIFDVFSENILELNYQCSSPSTNLQVLSGQIPLGEAHVSVTTNEDLNCKFIGTYEDNKEISVDIPISIYCGNKYKVDGKCVEFGCRQFQELTLEQILDVPERTQEGICYSIKLFDPISFGNSSLTQTVSLNSISRNHDGGGGPTRNPYQLGHFFNKFKLNGPRTVKLTGASHQLAPIKVDNFILVGLIPDEVSDPLAPNSDHYKAYGTADSTIPGTLGIKYLNELIELTPFGAAGTSTIVPLDITSNVQPNMVYHLDLHALDCGGSRELSEIHLLFQ